MNTISVESEATAIAINCGKNTCKGSPTVFDIYVMRMHWTGPTGPWDWRALTVLGQGNFTNNSPRIIF